MVVICKCSHVETCEEQYRETCLHAVPHGPMDWATNIPGELITDKFGICDTTSIPCHAGGDKNTKVICEVLHVFDPAPESLTCFRCADRAECPFVDDLYNTDGDCLASK